MSLVGDRLASWLLEQPRRYAPSQLQRLAAAIGQYTLGAGRQAA